MRTYETLGSAPYDEECVQVGSINYTDKMRNECERYKDLLSEIFPNLPFGCYFGLKRFSHDFGSYYEICLFYDDENEEHLNAMLHIDANLPSNWSI